MIQSIIAHQAQGGASDRCIALRNPSNGQPHPVWRSASSAQVDAAVQAARAAAPTWAHTPLADRTAVLRRYAAAITARAEPLAHAIRTEAGKPLWEARTEVQAVVGKVELSIQAYSERCREFGAGPARTRFRPHGVLAVLGPFNFPAHLPNGHIVPALLAGNTVVFKPSEKVPTAAQLMAAAWLEAGLPAGAFNLLQGDGPAGAALAAHPDIDGLLFTGGSAIGEALRRDFACRPAKMLALELGGNNPLVVWEPDDIDLAVTTILQSAFVTAGQRCTCARRLVLPADATGDRMLAALADGIDAMRIGPADLEPAVFMGPVIEAAAAHRLVAKQEDLISRGARPVRRLRHLQPDTGLVSPGLLDATAVRDLADEERFGPLLLVRRAGSFSAAVEEAGRTAYGLAAGLLDRSPERYAEFSGRIRAGIINWNTPLTGASGAAPFGGLGLSGNFRPSGFFAADYCSHAVASMEAATLNPVAAVPPGLRPN